MAFKIYTKTGDTGSTSLIGGTKVSKSHLRIESYGTVDELNSHTGLCRDLVPDESIRSVLQEIQDRLFTIGSTLAQDPSKESKLSLPDLHDEDINFLEKEIDRMTEVLPEMKSFILPGGHPTVSSIHITRCVCRRAERLCVKLAADSSVEYLLVIKYLNRLSDYFFVLARYVAMQLNVPETPWRPRV
ncbi:MAG: cob(I)yrinic acid a,c-diamide adenosyltransferase [Chitinophagaceae bacterium]|nr:MAG: cob(I)yrinic acid a,c-diamide adenosyltransferase [Chitinophagaceae bacterium]